ncbi:hypothetical protein [Maribellus mangrovi]|uniref:hypothetical protein n=1 Tax=Maribellus mangrovi TaxID=3133146 RepID=UPI0030EBF82B
MQERMIDGSVGAPMPFSNENLERSLNDPNVESVDVFRATPEAMRRRHDLFRDQQEAKARRKRKRKNRIAKKSRRS